MSASTILQAIKLAIRVGTYGLLALALWKWAMWSQAFEKLKTEYIADSQMAAYRHIAAKQAAESRYSKLAGQEDTNHAKALESAQRASDSFIARQLRTGNQCPSSRTATAAQGADSQLPEGTSADSILVSPADVKACTAAAVYGQSAHEWTKALIAEGLAE